VLQNGAWVWDDTEVYTTLANNLWQHGAYSQMHTEPYWPDTLRLPLYPILMLATGLSPLALLALQQVLLGLGVYALFALLTPYLGKAKARRAGLFWAIQPYPLWFAATGLTEIPFIALSLLTIWLADVYVRTLRLHAVVLAALCGSLAILLKGLAIPLVGLVVVYILISRGRGRKAWAHIGLAGLVGLGVVGPWLLRNHQLTGQLQLANQSHVAFWYGRIGGMEALRLNRPMDEETLASLADSMGRIWVQPESLYTYPPGPRTMDFAKLHPLAKQRGWQYVWSNPGLAIRFHALALWQMASGVGYRTAHKCLGSQTLAVAFAGFQAVCNLLMLAGLVLWVLRWRQGQRIGWLIAAVAAAFVFLHLAAWADGRYRMIADPLLVALGALACHTGIGARKSG
jgi:4-amino-4-deoxy-L-arabinose transferase-like glycosyltransferase